VQKAKGVIRFVWFSFLWLSAGGFWFAIGAMYLLDASPFESIDARIYWSRAASAQKVELGKSTIKQGETVILKGAYSPELEKVKDAPPKVRGSSPAPR